MAGCTGAGIVTTMAIPFQVTIDCTDPGRLAQFWAAALDYVIEPPPEGFDSWQEALTAWEVPESEWNSASAIVDPSGVGPRVFLQQVPEPKAAKNRLHLDLRISSGPGTPIDQRQSQTAPAVERLVRLGASELRRVEELGSYWVVLQDPEGNEFCVT